MADLPEERGDLATQPAPAPVPGTVPGTVPATGDAGGGDPGDTIVVTERGSLSVVARYVARRLGFTLVLAVGITLVAFCLTNVVPADPAKANLGEQAADDPEIVAAYRAKYGLDRPLPIQYVNYLFRLVHGDLGISQQTHRPVTTDLLDYAPATLELVIAAMLAAVLLGVSMGTLAAVRRNRLTDQVLRLIALLCVSLPIFWLGLVLSLVFTHNLGLLPSGGRLDPMLEPPSRVTGFFTLDGLLTGDWTAFQNALLYLVLPAVVLGSAPAGMLFRFTRATVLEILGEDYVRMARAKGLSPRSVMFRYVLRAALGPVLTVTGVTFGGLLAGTVLIESVFGWPGLGQYAYQGSTRLDLAAVMGVSLLVSLAYILVNLVVDVLHSIIDPRVRLS